MMRAERLENVKKEIRSVIITYPLGITLDVFLKAYKQLVGTRLPAREFGFVSDLDFLHSLPDIVRLQTDQNGEYCLNCIVDENIEHISKLVSKQRVTKPKPKSLSNGSFTGKNVNTSKSKPFVSAALRKNLFEILNDFPDGISYFPLLTAYQKKFKRPLNLDFLSENNHDRFEKLAIAVSELKVVTVNDTKRLYYCPLVRNKIEKSEENKFIAEKSLNYSNTNTQPNCGSQNIAVASDVSAVPKVVKEDFEKVLKLYPDGVLARHFPFLYERVSGEIFNLADLGYSDFMELADALPEIFIYVKRYDKPNDFMLFHPSFSEKAECLKENNKILEMSSEKSLKISNLGKKEIPTNIVSISVSYAQPQFPSDANLSVYIPVFLTAIISPSCFWFKLQFEDVICRFRELEEEMQCFYHSVLADSFKMPAKDIVIGATCAALYEDHWYRATITSSPRAEKITVYFVDYGGWEKVHCSKLSYLKSSFIHLPSQAFKAKLAQIKPPKGTKAWSVRAESRFSNLCNKSYIMAQIHLEYDDMVSVFLCDTSGEEDIHINDILVDENLAESFTADDFSSNSLSRNSQVLELNISVNENRNLNSSLSGEHKPSHNSIEKQRTQIISKKNPSLASRIPLEDKYVLHKVCVLDKMYVPAEELCHLFWSDKSSEVLKARLQHKNLEISTINISKEEHSELFEQCERMPVRCFQGSSPDCSLYPLADVMKILNCLGHPSINLREIIIQQVTCNESESLSVKNGLSDASVECDDDLKKYCLYDLKALYEAVKMKRMKLQRSHGLTLNNSALNELVKVEALIDMIEKRIEHLKMICSLYSNYE